MANIKSQKKRIITNEKARLRNRAVRSELKTATRAVHDAVEAKNGAEAYAAALAACRLLDRAVTKGVIHKNQAANRKSGIMKLANTVVTAEDIAAYKPAEKKAPAKTGSAAKAARKEAQAAAEKEKDKRRKKTQKEQAAAAKKKAEAEAAAAAEDEAAAAQPAAHRGDGNRAGGDAPADPAGQLPQGRAVHLRAARARDGGAGGIHL